MRFGMRKCKKIIAFLICVACFANSVLMTYAAEETDFASDNEIRYELSEKEYQDILEMDKRTMQRRQELLSQGYEFVKAEEIISMEKSSPTGKIVESTYKQPVKRKVVYSKEVFNSIANANNAIQVILGAVTKYVWVPVTLFGLSTNMISDYFSNGRNEITVDQNLHIKAAYYYDSSKDKYWYGYEAQQLVESISVVCAFNKSNGDPYHESKSRNYTYSSPHYYNDGYLFEMAVRYWNSSNIMGETYAYPSTVNIN